MVSEVENMPTPSEPTLQWQTIEDAGKFSGILWKWRDSDPLWPKEFADEDAVVDWVGRQNAAEVMGNGCARIIVIDGVLSGYAVWSRVPLHFAPGDSTPVECGTYLIPPVRGSGVNRMVKTAQINFSNQHFGADWVLFIVDVRNIAANKSLQKLPVRWHMETTDANGHFHAYLRRRNWETQTTCILFAVRTATPPR